MTDLRRASSITGLVLAALLSDCGGGTSNSGSSSPSTSPVTAQVSGSSPLSSSCGNTVPTGTTETFTVGSGIQPQIAAIPGGAVVGVWEQDRWTGIGARAILAARSTDSGATWSTPVVLPFSACAGGGGLGAGYDRASDPWVTFGGSGVMLASALAFSANRTLSGSATANGLSAVLVSRSTDGGASWSTPAAVIQDSNPSGSAAFFFNDRDSIAADASGNVYLVWDRRSSGVNASNPAYLALSKDAGLTWTTGVLYDPVTAGNEAFNNEIAILPSGAVLDFFTLIPSVGTSMLQFVTVTINGTSWSVSSPTTVATIQPAGTPNPTPSGMPLIRDSPLMAQIAVDPASGSIAAVWQQSTFGSTTYAYDGIALSVSKDGGTTWSTPTQVNGIKTVAAFDPTVRYLPGGVLAISYYDLRDYMAGSSVLSTSGWLSESADGGATWHELRLQAPFDLNMAPQADQGFGAALFLGDNQGLALVGTNPLPLYAATSSAGAHVYATQSPSPLTSSTAHVYEGRRLGSVPAAAAARAKAIADRIRLRAVSPAGRP
jgi:hypothetical protein